LVNISQVLPLAPITSSTAEPPLADSTTSTGSGSPQSAFVSHRNVLRPLTAGAACGLRGGGAGGLRGGRARDVNHFHTKSNTLSRDVGEEVERGGQCRTMSEAADEQMTRGGSVVTAVEAPGIKRSE